jgi:uncharacterized protein (TIGR00725 family)
MPTPPAARYVAVVGPGDAAADDRRDAEAIGAELARRGIVVVTGGLGGVMEAASRGAAREGGVTVGLLPGLDRSAANPHVTIAIPTGLGELRNGLVVRAADGVVAVGRGSGTLSEIALALKHGKPVVGLRSYDLEVGDMAAVSTPEDAVAAICARL